MLHSGGGGERRRRRRRRAEKQGQREGLTGMRKEMERRDGGGRRLRGRARGLLKMKILSETKKRDWRKTDARLGETEKKQKQRRGKV